MNVTCHGIKNKIYSYTRVTCSAKEVISTYILKTNKFTTMSCSNIYHSLNSVLTTLNDEKHKDNVGVQKVLNIYQSSLEVYKFTTDNDTKKYPLIVVEGLDGSGKTTTSRHIAKKLNAEFLCTPPKCIAHLRQIYEREKYLRSAFYSLGNYIAALNIRKILETKPVILDRFWHSTAAYEMALSIKDHLAAALPTEKDELYFWPKDLLKPDMVFYLSVSESERLRRHNLRNTTNTMQEIFLKNDEEFRRNVENAYKNMIDPSVNVIESDGTIQEVSYIIENKVKYLFQ